MEKVFAVEPRDDWIDVLMWNGSEGGIFGHTHYRFSESRRQTEWVPCSDREEKETQSKPTTSSLKYKEYHGKNPNTNQSRNYHSSQQRKK